MATTSSSSNIAGFVELTKPRILGLILITAGFGYYLGGNGIPSWCAFANTLIGTALTCAGAGVLNNFLERDVDARMHRTKKRSLPRGLVSPANALSFGVVLVLTGTVLLVWKVNLLTGFLALLTAFLYVLVYTPLKRVTWLNTLVGAIPGALPPLGGWAAATGHLSLGAWVLFAIMFIWQQPHFYAIAWMYRDDYARGGFKMLPVVEPDGKSTFRQILIYSILLIPVSILPTAIGMSGYVYSSGAMLLGAGILIYGFILRESKSVQDARTLLKATVFYLPLLLILLVADSKIWV